MPAVPRSDGSRFVLVTQCLQNDFFLNEGCRLKLPETVVPQMLVGNEDFDLRAGGNAHDRSRAHAIEKGPLGIFLDATVGRAFAGEAELHVINIRDWHVPGPGYDDERRVYGTHCEEDTWGVRYLEGTERWLDPTRTSDHADYDEKGGARIYHVRSDTVFDFKPRLEDDRERWGKFRASELEDLLDVLVQGSDQDLERCRAYLKAGGFSKIHQLAQEISSDDEPRTNAMLYVAVIGVFTDIKVQTLVIGLRTRYELRNLAVSDTFTAALTLERHLAGLDYAAKVCGVEIVHGVNDLVRFLGLPPPLADESAVVARMSFARYRTFFQDKQNVLAFQDEKLRQYLALTERRSLDVYRRIKQTNLFLIAFGAVFLTASLALAIFAAIDKDHPWEGSAITGGVGLLQVVTAFFSKPIRDLQQNLTNLAVFKMILESHSLKTALARFHLTTPRTLRELRDAGERELAAGQVDVLRQQVQAIQEFDSADFEGLAKLARSMGEGVDGAPANGAPPTPVVPDTQAAKPGGEG